MNLPAVLQFGDCLLYNRPGFTSFVIDTKEGGDVSHVEAYIGRGQVFASRNGIGVNTYDLDLSGLAFVRRAPGLPQPEDEEAALRWIQTVMAEGYDWLGLLKFFNAVPAGQPHHLFCSAAYTEFCRAWGVPVIAEDIPAGWVSPMDLRKTPALKTIWPA